MRKKGVTKKEICHPHGKGEWASRRRGVSRGGGLKRKPLRLKRKGSYTGGGEFLTKKTKKSLRGRDLVAKKKRPPLS